ncbi:hypothetical protein BD324DRAFT_612729 [Kockovaella imperatae]|uniref:Inositol-1-monophosphatase n=1 Tax=Kockovaella imperatae TaxID=4999 RepID=A0A1Y1USH4_9TREE|nr:hypothetical protein BD324DRAFT_612729 [Kockovaella imperatae]ORX40970.1 hypothetical protein BD324DRAFT_612729 [Kockovaella imperatae]
MSTDLNLQAILAFAIDVALEAGKMIKDGQAKRFAAGAGMDEKANAVDFVTEVDKAVEAFITERIHSQYPEFKFIGEETYDGQQITDEPTWIVDPIDGTTNFIHGYPMVATSIGLAVKGIPVLGVVYNPFTDYLYSAAKGHGAYLNRTTKLPFTGRPMPLESLSQALIGVEYGSKREEPSMSRKSKVFHTLAAHPSLGGKHCHSMRLCGSAALNGCLVATGGLDIYWEIGCWPWDVCAASCIITEAGGAIFGSKDKMDSWNGEANAEFMMERKYLFVRAISAAEGESAFEAQKKIANELLDIVEEWDP